MSNFKVTVEKVHTVEDHPNADRLSLVRVLGHTCISAKLDDGSHRYKPGDLVVYVGENTIVPDYLLKDGFWDETKGHGILGGKNHNVVKPIKLRGMFSLGILFPVSVVRDKKEREYVVDVRAYDPEQMFQDYCNATRTPDEGADVTEFMGFEKWEAPIPVHMAGDVYNIGTENTLAFDIENIKNFPDVLKEGEEVVITEKLHGTFVCFGFNAGEWFVTSKGMGARGLALTNNEANANNLYVRTFNHLRAPLEALSTALMAEYAIDRGFILGEIVGKGVQDLSYNRTIPEFRMFDIFLGDRYTSACEGRFMSAVAVETWVGQEIKMVPVLYTGPYSRAILDKHTNGSTCMGAGAHIREGVVVKPVTERYDPSLGRVALKSVSEAYLLRKNATEFQ